MFKKKHSVLAWLLCLVMVFSACGPAAQNTDAQTPEGTTAEATTAEPTTAEPEKGLAFTPGTYNGVAVARNGEVEIQCTFTADALTAIEVVRCLETEGVGDLAIEMLIDEVLEAQSLGVDSIAGATITSFAFKQALGSCVEQAGVASADFEAVPVEKNLPASIEETYDVVVVGAGGAGMAAGMAALEAGAKVIVIETNDIVGGNTLVSGMAWNAVDPELDAVTEIKDAQLDELQKFLDMDPATVGDFKDTLITLQDQIRDYLAGDTTYLFDSVEMHMMHFYKACVRTGLDGTQIVPDVDLCRTFCENSMSAIEWLEGNGIPFNEGLATVTGSLWPRGHSFVSKTGAFDRMVEIIETNGGKVMMNTHADELIYEDGKVVGIKATYEKEVPVTLHAKAVVLASGGFGGNREMADQYNNYWEGGLLNARSDQIASTQGDGIAMAVAIGADTEGMGYTQLFPAVNIVTGDNGPTGGNSAEYNCYINLEGKRFVNEFAERDIMSKAALQQPGGYFYHVIDQQMMDLRHSNGKGPNEEQLKVAVARGALFVCNTVEEMAKVIGCDAATLQATMDAYNKAVDDAYDPLTGRTMFGAKINVAPYYIMPVSPAIHNTMGGLKINTDTAVINTNGEVIPGLFAAGEVTGGIHAGNRMGGNAIGDAFTMGRIAGTNAAK